MPEKSDPPKPRTAPEKGGKSDRLAAALRANLARRKAQQKARAAPRHPEQNQKE
jgi:hypothetical protein